MKKLFVDTNIVIDLLQKREPFYQDAAKLFAMAYYKKVRLLVSPTTYTTASYLLQKNNPDVKMLLSNLRQLVRISTISEQTIDDSLASSFNDFEDAVQYYSAIRSKAEVIITRNGKDFATSKIPVMTAGEYLAALK